MTEPWHECIYFVSINASDQGWLKKQRFKQCFQSVVQYGSKMLNTACICSMFFFQRLFNVFFLRKNVFRDHLRALRISDWKFLTGFHFSLITLNDHNPQFLITLGIAIRDEHDALFD